MPRSRIKSTSPGFTLIELLVSITIMAILLGVGFANYRGFQRRQFMESAVRVIKTDLRYTQEQALAGKQGGCTQGLDGYFFRRLSLTSYRIEADCVGVADVYIKTVDLNASNPGIQIPAFSYLNDVGTSSSDFIKFKILGRGTSIRGGNQATITVTFPGSGLPNELIIISSGGDIY